MLARQRVSFFCALFLVAGAAAAGGEVFPRPARLGANVEFWKRIFATFSANQIVIHDVANPGRVYNILDFRADAGRLGEQELRSLMNSAEQSEIKRIRSILEKLHRHPDSRGLNVEEMRIRNLLGKDLGRDRFRSAADPKRIRGQRGIRERFLEGVQRSARYLPRMEQIFRAEGLPIELTRLPLVESSFNTHAYSKVGAAGMWQFMPATGRNFLRIDPAVDERLDPFVATRAAARFLRQNYDRLGTWPLALTAYNHGPGGMARAVREVGTTDIGVIVDRYQSPTFGFASKNFYAEFLAAVDVHRDYRNYFGEIALDPPLKYDEVGLPDNVSLRSVTRCAGGDLDGLKELNPALRPAAFSGERWLPSGYQVRVPPGAGKSFRECYSALPPSAKLDRHPGRTSGRQPTAARVHVVRRGETMSSIAGRYGTSVAEIRRANGLRNNNVIRVGQALKVSGGGGGAKPAARARSVRTHRVARGQTLAQIARRYGTSVATIRSANHLRSAEHIRVGQSLRIPH